MTRIDKLYYILKLLSKFIKYVKKKAEIRRIM